MQEGPFKGMLISEEQFWGQGDKASKILGFYEKEIQDLINQIQEKNNFPTFIDIGGADGFFAVGSVINNLFKNCEVFEISKRGRQAIEESAIKKNVAKIATITKTIIVVVVVSLRFGQTILDAS